MRDLGRLFSCGFPEECPHSFTQHTMRQVCYRLPGQKGARGSLCTLATSFLHQSQHSFACVRHDRREIFAFRETIVKCHEIYYSMSSDRSLASIAWSAGTDICLLRAHPYYQAEAASACNLRMTDLARRSLILYIKARDASFYSTTKPNILDGVVVEDQ